MAMLRRTTDNFSLDTRPVRAREARMRILIFDCMEQRLMKGMKRNGSSSSPVSLAKEEGLRRDRRISMGQRLGCTSFTRLDSTLLDDSSLRDSVATLSSSNKKECSEGYLQKQKLSQLVKESMTHCTRKRILSQPEYVQEGNGFI